MGTAVCKSARHGSAEVQIRLVSASQTAGYIHWAGKLDMRRATSHLVKTCLIIDPGSPLEIFPLPRCNSMGELRVSRLLLSPYPVITTN